MIIMLRKVNYLNQNMKLDLKKTFEIKQILKILLIKRKIVMNY